MENVTAHESDGIQNAQEPWNGLLAGARPQDHIVQLYQDHEFLKVNADPARLQQTFWNLLRNAGKLTSEGGHIFIRTESSADTVRLEVRDTGVGIEPEFPPKVFDAFEQGDAKITRQFGGLGVGLAICKAIVKPVDVRQVVAIIQRIVSSQTSG